MHWAGSILKMYGSKNMIDPKRIGMNRSCSGYIQNEGVPRSFRPFGDTLTLLFQFRSHL
jgi:hypothetical protein